MQPVKMVIHGEFWDTQLYKGYLYLFSCDGSVQCIAWERMIGEWSLPDPAKLAMNCAFQRSDYLYGNKWDLFFKDPEVRALIEHKFGLLLQSSLEIDSEKLRQFSHSTRDNPFPFPHADAAFHYNSLYSVSQNGLYVSEVDDDLEDSKRIWDRPINSVDAAHYSLALAAGEEGLYRFDLAEFNNNEKGYIPSELAIRNCTDCNWINYSVLGAAHGDGAVLAELTNPYGSSGTQQQKQPITVQRLVSVNEVLDINGFVWGSLNRICCATDGLLTIAEYKPQNKRRGPIVAEMRRIELQAWKGEPVAGAIATFGTILELDNCIVVVCTDGQIITLPGEPVNWRIFPRSKCYENQLHIVYDDRIEIYSFNHDYFVEQKGKVTGIIHKERPQFSQHWR